MKTSSGNRKLTSTFATQLFLLAGLLVVLLAAGWFKMDAAICVQGFFIYAGSIIGGHAFFVGGNAMEHKYAQPKAPAAPPTPSP